VLVIPAVFALTYEGFGNLQIALFAAFGGFASLIVASFGGSRRDKLVLEWCTTLIADATDGHLSLDRAPACDRELFAAIAAVLRQTGDLLAGQDGTTAWPDVGEIERRREASVACHRELDPGAGHDSVEVAARRAIHAQMISLAVRDMVGDALIATRRADPETIAARRRRWYGAQRPGTTATALPSAIRVMARHASVRSVWFQNSLRGSLALAAAVLVADQTGVPHRFWVVLGTLSVLRTNAVSTGSTALRALGGTVIGFAAGALLLLGVGTSTPVLWAVLPIAIAVAAYAPGTLPFAVGQAAFTIVVVILFNLLQPVGWTVGLLRVQDVAMGCAVSLVVGVLFWPRGASSVVGDDLADAFRRGVVYLTQAVDWALGTRRDPPDTAAAAVTAGLRLDEALRGFAVEQGAKRLSKQDLSMLVVATKHVRLTATSLASLQALAPGRHHHPVLARGRATLEHDMADLAGFYERVAALVGRPAPHEVVRPVSVPALVSLDGNSGIVRVMTAPHLPHLLWVQECLYHLSSYAQAITGPAAHMAEQRRLPWWR